MVKNPPANPGLTGWYAFAVSVIALVTLTIWCQSLYVGDTDLWYHLAGGRYLAQTGHIPNTSHFSYLEPARQYTNYYWLFQYLVFQVYDHLGYQGLAVLRLLLSVATFTTVALLFAPTAKEDNLPYIARRFLFAALCFLFAARYTNLRPHTVSYLLALGSIYILERKPSAGWLVPILALLWVNFHGVTYPVLFIICLSYLAGIYLRRLRGHTGPEDKTLHTALFLALSMGAALATPNGAELLSVPFRMSENINAYILEMARPSLAELFALQFDWLTPRRLTVSALLILACGGALLRGALRRNLTTQHLLLFLGGLYLLTKAGRFQYEFAILAAPLVLSLLLPLPGGGKEPEPTLWRYAMPFAVLASLTLTVLPALKTPGRIPFSNSDLPTGSIEFLKKLGGGGKLHNHATPGGFLQWELYPEYKIQMDMQVPFLFTDADIFLYQEGLQKADTLGRTLDTYRPQYLLDQVKTPNYSEVITKLSDYRPVFVDDCSVLYANKLLVPEVVEKYEIKELPLYTLGTASYETLIKEKPEEKVLGELQRLNEVWHKGGSVNLWLAQAYKARGEYDKALVHAQSVIASHPDRYNGYLLAGEILRKQEKYTGSVELLEKGLEYAGGVGKRAVHRALGLTRQQEGNAEAAYTNLRLGIVWTDPALTADDYWRLACVAMLVNKPLEAVEAAQYAETMVKKDDGELAVSIRNFLALMGARPLLPPMSAPASPGTQTADAPRN